MYLYAGRKQYFYENQIQKGRDIFFKNLKTEIRKNPIFHKNTFLN